MWFLVIRRISQSITICFTVCNSPHKNLSFGCLPTVASSWFSAKYLSLNLVITTLYLLSNLVNYVYINVKNNDCFYFLQYLFYFFLYNSLAFNSSIHYFQFHFCAYLFFAISSLVLYPWMCFAFLGYCRSLCGVPRCLTLTAVVSKLFLWMISSVVQSTYCARVGYCDQCISLKL